MILSYLIISCIILYSCLSHEPGALRIRFDPLNLLKSLRNLQGRKINPIKLDPRFSSQGR